MVEFAFALVGKLDVINKHSFNDFRLRIGENIYLCHKYGHESELSPPIESWSWSSRVTTGVRYFLPGINHGPVIAGVIGAQKPQYDIWGNSVNVASRMETTGVLGKIQVGRKTAVSGAVIRLHSLTTVNLSPQVTEETSHILSTLGYMCSCRGIINVKGKGDLKTYFVNTEMTRSLSQGTVMPY